jgi:hypothetical protein
MCSYVRVTKKEVETVVRFVNDSLYLFLSSATLIEILVIGVNKEITAKEIFNSNTEYCEIHP